MTEKEVWDKEEAFNKNEEEVTKLQKEKEELNSLLYKEENSKNSVAIKLENVRQKLYESYNMDYEEATNSRDAEMSYNMAQTKAREFRTKISSLGNVNVDAIEQYKEISTNGKQWILDIEAREREATGIRNLKIGYTKVFGYYIEITKSFLNQVPEDRFIRKQTLTNGERFITEELKELETKILGAEEKIISLEYNEFVKIRTQIAQNISRLQTSAMCVAKIDVLSSDGITTATYYISVNRQIYSNNFLSYILPSQGKLEPSFDKKTVNYEIFVDDTVEEGETAMITLVSAKDKEPFYKKFGFIERPNEDRGAGMYMFHEKK